MDFANLDIDELQRQQNEANQKKNLITSLGSIADAGDRMPSAYDIHVNKSNVGTGNSAKMYDQAAKAVVDPMDQAKQKMALWKDEQMNKMAALNYDSAQKQAKYSDDEHDVNSSDSKLVRSTIEKLYPGKYTPEQLATITSANRELVYKPLELDAKLREAAEAARYRAEITRQNQFDRNSKNAAERDSKDSQALDRHLSNGWTGRSGQAGAVQAKINAAEAAEALAEQGKHQDGGLDSRQIEELAQSAARMLGGGASASARVEALVPHTLGGRAQSLAEYISGNPKGANQQAFVDRIVETIQREKALARDQQRQYQIEGLASFNEFKKRNPEQFRAILRSKGITDDMIDENGRYVKGAPPPPGGEKSFVNQGLAAPSAPRPHPQDGPALKWALLNPQDPKAKEIMKSLGIVKQ